MAVKVLAREVVAPEGVERFLQEIRVTARLNHPHVLPVHDSGEASGLLYYVMPYVEGETLRTRLNSSSPLSVQEILRLLRELADALSFAHARGIVHRDLKPENVLLSGGHAVVGDFGIAKALTDAAETRAVPGAESGTSPIVLGTPAYMAPEQADGTMPIDHRCDFYAFGLVAYELLAACADQLRPTPPAENGTTGCIALAPPNAVRRDVLCYSRNSSLVNSNFQK